MKKEEATAAAGLFCGATVVKLLSTIKQLKENVAEKQAALEAELARRVKEASGGCGIITTALNWVLVYVWSVLKRVVLAKPSNLIKLIDNTFKDGTLKYEGQRVDIGECKSRFSQFYMSVTEKGVESGVDLRVVIEPKDFHLIQQHVGLRAFTISSVRFLVQLKVSLTPQTLFFVVTSADVNVRLDESWMLQLALLDKAIEKKISDGISESLKALKGFKRKLNVDDWLVAVVSGEGRVPALLVEEPPVMVVPEPAKGETVPPEPSAVPEPAKGETVPREPSAVPPEPTKGETVVVMPPLTVSQEAEEDILAKTQANVEQAVAPVLSDTEVRINKELDERRSECDKKIDIARSVFQKQVKQNKSKDNKKEYSTMSTATCDDIIRNTAFLLKDQEDLNAESCALRDFNHKRIGVLNALTKKLSESALKQETEQTLTDARKELSETNNQKLPRTCTALQRAIDTINVRA